jgi:lipopolysaccharide export system ATP-binding protein
MGFLDKCAAVRDQPHSSETDRHSPQSTPSLRQQPVVKSSSAQSQQQQPVVKSSPAQAQQQQPVVKSSSAQAQRQRSAVEASPTQAQRQRSAVEASPVQTQQQRPAVEARPAQPQQQPAVEARPAQPQQQRSAVEASPVQAQRQRSAVEVRPDQTQQQPAVEVRPDQTQQQQPAVEAPIVQPSQQRRTDIQASPESLLNDEKFDELRHKKKSGEDLTSDYIDRRKSPRATDRRHSKRDTSGVNTLTIIDLRKNFGSKEIVRGVGFSMKGGEVAGLLGPNGAGKTTIFYMIVGFYKPSTGDIKLNGISITNGPMYRRARMGIAYLPQEASIFRKLTVEQNIWAILESRNDLTKKQKKQKLDELIDDFGIDRIRKQYGYTLSGGERRRTEIARALAIDPKFLLLDEPFAGIDPIAVYEIKQIINRLSCSEIGILITDHNVRDTLEITNTAFIINHGLIVARGDRNHILANQTVRDVYLGSEFKM